MNKILILFTLLFVFIVSSAFAKDIKVYDANEVFIGYLVDIDDNFEVDIYVPSLGKFVNIVYKPEAANAGIIDEFELVYFSGTDCSGSPYIYAQSSDGQLRYYIRRHCSKFYTFSNDSNGSSSISASSLKGEDCACFNFPAGSLSAYPATEVTLPFDYPIALPLKVGREIEGKTVIIPMVK